MAESIVLDTSAILALTDNEPGADKVQERDTVKSMQRSAVRKERNCATHVKPACLGNNKYLRRFVA